MSIRQQFLNRVRVFNKHVLNRFMLRIAGVRYSPIALIHHVGRNSGKSYQTPIIVQPADDGFVIALTYGPEVDWYKNILAAGRCRMVWHGKEYDLNKLTPLDTQAAMPAFPKIEQFILQRLGVRDFFSATH